MTQTILTSSNEPDAHSVLLPADPRSNVSTAEFAAAINRIEARRAQDTARANGTVNVEQTIRELHIDASSEEVLREIAAMRSESYETERIAAAEASTRLALKRTRGKRIVWRILAGFGLVMIGALGQLTTDYHHQYHGTVSKSTPDTDRTVGRLGSGQEMFMTSGQLEQLIGAGADLHNSPIASIDGTSSLGGSSVWPVVRSGDNLYVYGYESSEAYPSGSTTQQISATDGDDETLVVVPLKGATTLDVSADTPLSSDSITLTNLPPHLTDKLP